MLANARPFIAIQIIFLLSIVVDAKIKQDRALSSQLVVGIITVLIDDAIRAGKGLFGAVVEIRLRTPIGRLHSPRQKKKRQ